MNLADSETMAGILSGAGMRPVADPGEADLIVVNTCTVRETAVSRVIARIARFKPLKRTKPGLKIAVTGCLAEQEKEGLFKRLPFVDYILGPDQYRFLAGLDVEKGVRTGAGPRDDFYNGVEQVRREIPNAWIPVMRGCDNFCSYCIVPYVRGRERSRPPEEVAAEAGKAVADGFPQVTLLGQNVNSYRGGGVAFPELLRRVDGVPGLKRLRFMTSHPKDLSEDLIACFGTLPTLCEHLHLPVQSGSDSVLGRMNRGYTAAHYLGILERLRKQSPGMAFSTDILCGFPGETDEDHRATVELVKQAGFDAAFMFIYSVRPGTRAEGFGDTVPREVKVERLNEIIRLQMEMTEKKNRACLGGIEEVLVEGLSPQDENHLTSRTRTFKNVIFRGNRSLIGSFCRVRVTGCAGWALIGEIIV